MTNIDRIMTHHDSLSPTKAALLRRKLGGKRAGRSLESSRTLDERNPVTRLTFEQERLWYAHHVSGQATTVYMGVKIKGPLNRAALRDALNEIARRHHVLRTTFHSSEDITLATVLAGGNVSVRFFSLERIPAKVRSKAVRRLATVQALHNFDLVRGPLFRCVLLNLAPDEHALVLTAHHLVLDGLSIKIIGGELWSIYTAYSKGTPSSLPTLEWTYADYARSQRVDTSVIQTATAYWKRQFRDLPPRVRLPYDLASGTARLRPAGIHRISIASSLLRQIEDVARSANSTLLTALLSSYAVLLSRYTLQDEIAIACPMSTRDSVCAISLIGCFVSTPTLNIDLSGDPTFVALLQRTRQTVLDAYAHRSVSFHELVGAGDSPPSLQSSLFQIAFSLIDAPLQTAQVESLEIEPFDCDSLQAHAEIAFECYQAESELQVVCIYDASLFRESSIQHMLLNFQGVLEHLCRQPAEPISSWSILTPAEARRHVSSWSESFEQLPQDQCLHHLVDRQCDIRIDSIAVVCREQHLSYGMLNRASSRVCQWLSTRDAGPDLIVALKVPASLELIVAIVGVLKSGAAYLPLDGAEPIERELQMLDETRVRLLLHSGGCDLELPAGVTAADIGEILVDLAADRTESPPVNCHPTNLAYVIYTSGSTGKPKGVLIEHRNVVRLIEAAKEYFDFGSTDVWTSFHSHTFDFSVWEIWGALCHGCKLVIVPPESRQSPDDTMGILMDERITVFNQTPTYFGQLARLIAQQESCSASLLALRYVIFGGERLEPAKYRTWAAMSWPRSLQWVNMYGITETTVHVTAGTINPDATQDKCPRRSTIGRPLKDLYLYVLDQQLRPVGTLVPGEFYIGGAGLARGYIASPKATKSKFLYDSLSKVAGKRIYKSGDLGIYCGHQFEFIGRLDGQMKHHGFRIEAGEIEHHLLQFAGVLEAVVMQRHDSEDDSRLTAYLVLAADAGDFNPERIRKFLSTRLPHYMVPAFYVRLPQIPVTRNGKIDYSRLPKSTAGINSSISKSDRPSMSDEDLLAMLWAQVLRVDHVGLEDDFLSLGGHSLLLAELAQRIRETFFLKIPIHSLGANTTFAAMSKIIGIARGKQSLGDNADASLAPVAQRPIQTPLSIQQMPIWLAVHTRPTNPIYQINAAVVMRGPVCLPAIRQAIGEISRRHEVLRTSFLEILGEPRQQIQLSRIDVHIADLSQLSITPLKAWDGYRANWAARRDTILRRGEVVRVSVFKCADEHYLVAITIHHIISDAQSMEILLREINELYESFCDGKASQLSELPLQYSDYVLWQSAKLDSHHLERLSRFWNRQLEDAEAPSTFPGDMPRSSIRAARAGQQVVQLSAKLTRAIRIASAAAHGTVFMYCAAALGSLLYLVTRQSALTIGTGYAHRANGVLQDLIGCFVYNLPLRVDVDRSKTFEEIVSHVRNAILSVYDHSDIPFERLVALRQNDHPLCRVVIGFRQQMTAAETQGAIVARLQDDRAHAKFDLELQIVDEGEQLILYSSYDTGIYSRRYAESLLDAYQKLLVRVIEAPESTLDAIAPVVLESLSAAAPMVEPTTVMTPPKFRRVPPRPIVVLKEESVRMPVVPAQLPFVIDALTAEVDPIGWIQQHRERIETELTRWGSVALRGFNLQMDRLMSVASAISKHVMEYQEQSTPRRRVAEGIYTSTEYSSDQCIPMHNENSYSHAWPRRLLFFCKSPAERGGETLLADSRRVLDRLPRELVEEFDAKRVMYVRNFTEHVGVSWKAAFQTDDRAQVERYCKSFAIDFEWIDATHLRTKQVRPAIIVHPVTKERVWFNQAHLFHVSSLPPRVAASVTSIFQQDELPRHSFFGDGSPIDVCMLEDIREAYRQETVAHRWRAGDLLLVDNVLVAHGRASFEGPREVLVVMLDPNAETRC